MQSLPQGVTDRDLKNYYLEESVFSRSDIDLFIYGLDSADVDEKVCVLYDVKYELYIIYLYNNIIFCK